MDYLVIDQKYFKVNKKEIQDIIHDIFTSYQLTNESIANNEEYTSIIECIFSVYTNMNAKKMGGEDPCNTIKETIEDLIIERIINEEGEISSVDLETILAQLDFLDTVPQPAQRTPEWYTFRANKITASDFAVPVNKNPYSDRNSLILKKCGHETPFVAGPAVTHGVKFEDVAVDIYEDRCGVSISEYGCIPHPKHDFLGASPDGICNKTSKNKEYIGRMLEIKCPKSRKLNGFVPEYYYYQVQGQLEICELEYCDFLECVIKEYNTRDEFIEDTGEHDYVRFQKNGMERGVLIELYDYTLEKPVYRYFNSREGSPKTPELDAWIDTTISAALEDDNLDYITTTYWKLEEYSCILVKRDLKFWDTLFLELDKCWKEIIYRREHGIQDILTLKDSKKRKKKPDIKLGKEYDIALLPDSDGEGL
jgi:putative phage-type endonuclease